jgi:hypothetical protein
MYETDRIPASWVQRCNRMDEVWVPTEVGGSKEARVQSSKYSKYYKNTATDADEACPPPPCAVPRRVLRAQWGGAPQAGEGLSSVSVPRVFHGVTRRSVRGRKPPFRAQRAGVFQKAAEAFRGLSRPFEDES